MKKFLKNWNWFEIVFLALSLIGLSLCFAFTPDRNWFSYVVSLVGVVSVMTVAKGLVFAPFINIAYNIIYSIISVLQHYYGEAIIYIGLMIPIAVASIVSWLRNKNKENTSTVQVNKIKGIEYLYLFIGAICATVAFYFLLRALNTSELIISTLSLISSVIASYLLLRRCSYYALAFVANDIILIVLWTMAIIYYGTQFLPIVISFCIFLINDIYGFIHWKIQERKQNISNKNQTAEKVLIENNKEEN